MGAPWPCQAGEPSCLAVDVALGFVDHQLSPALRAEVERRIDACPSCREIVAEAARNTEPEVRSDDEAGTKVERPGGRVASPRPAANDPPEHAGLERLEPGEVVGRYVVEKHLGAGGMGVVTLARDPALRRAVVIKLVRPDVFASRDEETAYEARLEREAQAMAQLSHPNVVQIFDTGRHRDRVFLAMEYVPGQTLDDWLIESPRTHPQILAKFAQAGAGLAAAHHAGLVHRDFKPSNVLVNPEGLVKVTDFGLARAVVSTESSISASPAPRRSGVHAILTQADSVIGTPAYMAPEQAAGEPVDARSDQYSFALALVDGLLDQQPSRRKVSVHDLAELETALAMADVPGPIRAALLRALSEAPASRFATIDDLLAALAPRKRRNWPLLMTLLVVAVVGVAWFASRPGSAPSCVADAARRWLGEPRALVVEKLGESPQPFASWRAELIAGTIDRSVEQLGVSEVALCQGAAAVDAWSTPACVEHRRAALDALSETLSTRPSAGPWAAVKSLARCDGAPEDPSLAKLAADELAAETAEAAGIAAFKRFEMEQAEGRFREQLSAGEGNDATRGRATLHLLEVARWRGDHANVLQSAQILRAMLRNHPRSAREELVVSWAEAIAFTEVGDVLRADAAWESTLRAAEALHDPDRLLRARVTRAKALHALHLDIVTAREQARAAIARAIGASDDALREAYAGVGELALIAGDGVAASEAFGKADGTTLFARLGALRATALGGDVDGALQALDRLQDFADPLRSYLIEVARLEILVAARRFREAKVDVLDDRGFRLTWIDPAGTSGAAVTKPFPQAVSHRIAVALLRCQAVLHHPVTGPFIQPSCSPPEFAEKLHPRAPDRARLHLAVARGTPALVRVLLPEALEILSEIKAPPVVIAEVQWELARGGEREDGRALAEAALAAFRAAGKLDEVARITAWLSR